MENKMIKLSIIALSEKAVGSGYDENVQYPGMDAKYGWRIEMVLNIIMNWYSTS